MMRVGGVLLTEATGRDGDGPCFEVSVPAESSFFEGHFPGQPLLPAAAILTLVAEAARIAFPEDAVTGFDAVRFSSPVAPGCAARLEFRNEGNGSGPLFELATGDRVLTTGRIHLRGSDA